MRKTLTAISVIALTTSTATADWSVRPYIQASAGFDTSTVERASFKTGMYVASIETIAPYPYFIGEMIGPNTHEMVSTTEFGHSIEAGLDIKYNQITAAIAVEQTTNTLVNWIVRLGYQFNYLNPYLKAGINMNEDIGSSFGFGLNVRLSDHWSWDTSYTATQMPARSYHGPTEELPTRTHSAYSWISTNDLDSYLASSLALDVLWKKKFYDHHEIEDTSYFNRAIRTGIKYTF